MYKLTSLHSKIILSIDGFICKRGVDLLKHYDIETVINDIEEKEKNIVKVELDVYCKDEFIDTYNIELNLINMNLDCKMDYEFQLSKDLNRTVINYFRQNGKLPTDNYIKETMENKNYLIIQNKEYANER